MSEFFHMIVNESLNTGMATDNSEVLYALSCATKQTEENVTPDRLIEMAGIYYPPNSKERVLASLNDLQEMAFVYSEETNGDKAYKLTDMGDSLVGFLDRFSKIIINSDNMRGTLSPDTEKTLGDMSEKEKEIQRELYRRFRKVERRFKRGI